MNKTAADQSNNDSARPSPSIGAESVSGKKEPWSVGESSPLYESRPWGSFTILDEGVDFKVKRLEVLPGKRLSYQKHSRRSEHWYVVRGVANITLDGETVIKSAGESVDITVGTAHRVENPGSELLVFVEVQTGDYFGEDDIVRIEDDFGR